MGRAASAGRLRWRTGIATVATLVACLIAAMPAVSHAAAPKTITIGGATPGLGNCFPFGVGSDPNPLNDWRPFFGFVYQNIPPFDLKAGDTLEFDLGIANDHDIRLDLAMAPATNGTNTNSTPFTTIVTNSQLPTNPRGNDTTGDYELGFISDADFNFPGGGLIIRASNPGPGFIDDQTCVDGRVAGIDGSDDPGDFFVGRVFQDTDGTSPWNNSDGATVGQFRLILSPTSNQFKFGKVLRSKRKGTAELFVSVPAPGTLTMTGKGVKARTATGTAAGDLKLLVKPKGKLRQRLNGRHRAKTRLSVTFIPGGDPPGDPSTQSTKLKLIKSHP